MPARITTCIACLLLAVSSKAESFQLGPIQASPGQVASGYLEVPAGEDPGTRIPVTVVHGAKPGPVLTLIAGTHGTEFAPILALQRLRTGIDPKELTGTVILVQLANSPAFFGRLIQEAPSSGKNLNRVYPGKKSGCVKQRIAHVIAEQVIKRSDFLMDLHTGTADMAMMPLALAWSGSGDAKVDEATRAMALATGLDHLVVEAMPEKAENCGYTDCYAMRQGIPAITTETGRLGETSEEWVALAERSALNVLTHLKMLPRRSAQPSIQQKAAILFSSVGIVKSPADGLFYPEAKAGQSVKKGDRLGRITDFFGQEIAVIQSPHDGLVCSICRWPTMTKGFDIAWVCQFSK